MKTGDLQFCPPAAGVYNARFIPHSIFTEQAV